MPFWAGAGGALIGGAGSILGGLFGSSSAKKMTKWQARFNAREALIARQWQETMANTAVRRRMNDFEQAGINPLLAAKYDADTPSGAMASMSGAGLNSATGFAQGAGAIGSAIGTGLQAMRTSAEVKKIDQEVENLLAEEDLTREQIDNTKELFHQIHAQTELMHKEGLKIDYQNIVSAMITQFQQEHPTLTVMQHFGLDGKALTDLAQTVLGGGFLGIITKWATNRKKIQ